MSTAAQIESNIRNAQSSTGPITEAGKAAASRNAITFGLFAARDFIRPGEDSAYSQLSEQLEISLAPLGPLECNLFHEIRRAIWRLRRCSQIEEGFSTPETNDGSPDPMQLDATAKLQFSVDRARSLSHRLLHKSTAELRKLQTERFFRNDYLGSGKDISHLGLCDVRAVRKTVQQQELRDIDEAFGSPSPCPSPTPVPSEPSPASAASASFCKNTESPAPPPASVTNDVAPFCENAQTPVQTPRNAPCPCGSRQKYKRCCGKQAKPVLNKGAKPVLNKGAKPVLNMGAKPVLNKGARPVLNQQAPPMPKAA